MSQWRYVTCDGPSDHDVRLMCVYKLVTGWGSCNYIPELHRGMIEVWAIVGDFGAVDVWARATNPDTNSLVPESETHSPRKGEGGAWVPAWRRIVCDGTPKEQNQSLLVVASGMDGGAGAGPWRRTETWAMDGGEEQDKQEKHPHDAWNDFVLSRNLHSKRTGGGIILKSWSTWKRPTFAQMVDDRMRGAMQRRAAHAIAAGCTEEEAWSEKLDRKGHVIVPRLVKEANRRAGLYCIEEDTWQMEHANDRLRYLILLAKEKNRRDAIKELKRRDAIKDKKRRDAINEEQRRVADEKRRLASKDQMRRDASKKAKQVRREPESQKRRDASKKAHASKQAKDEVEADATARFDLRTAAVADATARLESRMAANDTSLDVTCSQQRVEALAATKEFILSVAPHFQGERERYRGMSDADALELERRRGARGEHHPLCPCTGCIGTEPSAQAQHLLKCKMMGQ